MVYWKAEEQEREQPDQAEYSANSHTDLPALCPTLRGRSDCRPSCATAVVPATRPPSPLPIHGVADVPALALLRPPQGPPESQTSRFRAFFATFPVSPAGTRWTPPARTGVVPTPQERAVGPRCHFWPNFANFPFLPARPRWFPGRTAAKAVRILLAYSSAGDDLTGDPAKKFSASFSPVHRRWGRAGLPGIPRAIPGSSRRKINFPPALSREFPQKNKFPPGLSRELPQKK